VSTEIIVAVIAAAGAVVAAVISAAATRRKKKSELQNTPIPSVTLHDVSSNQVVVGTNNNVECYLQPKEDSYIEIVDVDFDINKDGYYLDIKLRNSGDKIAFIKKIIFNMHDVFAMPNPQITQYSLVLPTATYDIVLNGEKQQAFSLSQSVGYKQNVYQLVFERA
jgi:hypothetical protein